MVQPPARDEVGPRGVQPRGVLEDGVARSNHRRPLLHVLEASVPAEPFPRARAPGAQIAKTVSAYEATTETVAETYDGVATKTSEVYTGVTTRVSDTYAAVTGKVSETVETVKSKVGLAQAPEPSPEADEPLAN